MSHFEREKVSVNCCHLEIRTERYPIMTSIDKCCSSRKGSNSYAGDLQYVIEANHMTLSENKCGRAWYCHRFKTQQAECIWTMALVTKVCLRMKWEGLEWKTCNLRIMIIQNRIWIREDCGNEVWSKQDHKIVPREKNYLIQERILVHGNICWKTHMLTCEEGK